MVEGLPDLTPGQFSLVYNMFSFTVATMFAAFVYFVQAQKNLAPKYRVSMMVSSLVVFIAGYHYFRIFNSWDAAYVLNDAATMYEYSGKPFNDAYRYVDWLLTVPLLVIELVMVSGLPKGKSGSMMARLGIAAAAMIALGYPGEIATDTATRVIWGIASTVPFIYILYVLFTELGSTINEQTGEVKVLLKNARLLMLFTWGFYPIVYMAPFAGFEGASSLVTIQVGYTIADVAAKAGFGVLIYAIAKGKSEQEGFVVDEMAQPVAAQ
ncbi:bacteriorhodopsin-like [Salisaeta longa]|uniref:bacteriorhodopsin-like n=1 Tax=Salisaeta longa TaxID=503170 RepID=UPI0003B640DC|nr:bacteriorhodopsin-like [Salisaeta longa]